ncbi:MAG: bifunctional precorrin-2 dehydrogenase/sirohydrochlorin ferrochelatase, partial [Kangiellaceae bacterium]|nr:bifunctional precorrin-2 dehydrogenase/sirohydrochlorin ferrochelatase [Kangiellaceae bacterium]
MEFLPINIDIKGQPCLIIGGGEIALRKGSLLIKAGAKVRFLATEFISQIISLGDEGKAEVTKQVYQSDCLMGQRLIVAATDDLQVNRKISQDANAMGLLVNVVDQKILCNFIMPSIVNRGSLSISISSSGAAPVLARMLREKLEWLLPQNLAGLLERIELKRAEVTKL